MGFNSTIVGTQEDIDFKFKIARDSLQENSPSYDSDMRKLNEAYDCLKFQNCRSQYIKFGSFQKELSGEENAASISKLDWRLLYPIAFFMAYLMIGSSLSGVEQKPGLRVAMALGVILCMNEVQWYGRAEIASENEHHGSWIAIFIRDGIHAFFPNYYCIFEKIEVMHTLFICLYNLCCSFSLVYTLNEHQTEMESIRGLINTQT
mmetsp:Transcript_25699/g.19426  ORF Transcript_25699/g.19426 Transcript_25699/m.19426 type:complete len:205 (+) Transcript_25699:170-784(+)